MTWLGKILGWEAPQRQELPATAPQPTQTPDIAPVSPQANIKPKATLTNLCTAIRDFEGQPGDQNYRLHNPGNFRFSTIGYLAIYEPVKCSPNGFAIFKDDATGWLYMQNAIKVILHKHPDLTLLTFIGGDKDWSGYSPASDGNPVTAYATHLAARLGVDKAFALKNLMLV